MGTLEQATSSSRSATAFISLGLDGRAQWLARVSTDYCRLVRLLYARPVPILCLNFSLGARVPACTGASRVTTQTVARCTCLLLLWQHATAINGRWCDAANGSVHSCNGFPWPLSAGGWDLVLSGVHQRHHHSEACRCGGRTTRSLATGPPTLLPRSSVEYHPIPRARDRREGPQETTVQVPLTGRSASWYLRFCLSAIATRTDDCPMHCRKPTVTLLNSKRTGYIRSQAVLFV